MRELNVKEITAAVAKLCCDACYYLPQDLLEKFKASRDTEESPLGREVLETMRNLPRVKMCPCARIPGLPWCFWK